MMTKTERAALFKALTTIVREAISVSNQAIVERIAVIEARPLPEPSVAVDIESIVRQVTERIPKPLDGKDVDINEVERMVAEHSGIARRSLAEDVAKEINERFERLPKPQDGKDGRDGVVNTEAVDAAINARIAAGFKKLQLPKDGKDGKDGRDGKDADPVDTAAIVAEVLRQLPLPKDGKPGQPGKDAEPVDVDSIVRAVLAQIPKPKDGVSIHPDTVRLMVMEEVKKEFATVPKPENGKPGEPGRDALSLEPTDGIDFERSYVIGQWATHNGALWRCMDGKQWKCMVDGIYDVDESHDGERTITTTYRWASGKEKTFTRNTKEMKQRGIYKQGQEYAYGDVVTFGGSQWYCQVERTSATPKEGENHDWVLIVRRGRDGKSFEPPAAPRGPVGLK